jgi:acyl-CoA thioesterase-2
MEFAEGGLSELLEAMVATPVSPVGPVVTASDSDGADGADRVDGVEQGDGVEQRGGADPNSTCSTYSTTSPDWWGGERTFGGMVVAQALSAATRTVPPDFEVHSLHGYFLRPSRPGTRSIHQVQRLRDGRSFSAREVVSEVEASPTFQMTCSFHRVEAGAEYQLPIADDVPMPEAIEGSDAPFPFEVRDLGATERRHDGTYLATRRCWFRTRQRLADEPWLHACVLAYLSDMTGSAFRPLSLNSWGGYTDASLDHALWFHRSRRADEWNLFDFQALVNANGRSTIRGTMYGEDGVLYLSMAQELLIRPL